MIQLGGREATASVALKHWAKSHRVYAYLRFWHEGRTEVLYIGDVTATSRAVALEKAWEIVHAKGLLKNAARRVVEPNKRTAAPAR